MDYTISLPPSCRYSVSIFSLLVHQTCSCVFSHSVPPVHQAHTHSSPPTHKMAAQCRHILQVRHSSLVTNVHSRVCQGFWISWTTGNLILWVKILMMSLRHCTVFRVIIITSLVLMLSRAGVTLASFPCSLINPPNLLFSQLVESVTVSSSWLGLQILWLC